MPTTSGLSSSPIIRLGLITIISSALLATTLDIKHHFYFSLPLISRLGWTGWTWRVLGGWWMCYTNSADVLFAGVVIYQLRIVERIWGSRKTLSFILATLPYSIILPPLILYTLNLLTLRSTHIFTTLPNGPTALIFALLAQYHASIPHAYRYRVSSPISASSSTSTPRNTTPATTATTDAPPSTPPSSNQNEDEADNSIGILLTSKSLSYLPALQLAFSSLPGSLIPAITGWLIGYAWRWEMLPYPVGSGWRVSDRVWGLLGGTKAGGGRAQGQGVEGLRRRMESETVVEGVSGSVDAANTAATAGGGRLRGWGVESMLGGRSGGAAGDRARRRD